MAVCRPTSQRCGSRFSAGRRPRSADRPSVYSTWDMAAPLSVFLSSTVEDLGAVRDEIAARLRARGIEVRMSERPEFPVEPGLTSHDACLAAVRNATVFVLLIAQRYGGEYQRQNKSITWREWEEACRAGSIIVSLVERRANQRAIEIFSRRRELQGKYPKEDVVRQDARLLKEFPDSKPLVHNMPGVQRFIDAIRKGHKDNWVNGSWTGTADDALVSIDSHCGAALATYHARGAGMRELAHKQTATMMALAQVSRWTALAAADVRAARKNAATAQLELLRLYEILRHELLGFEDGDRHNFMIYLRERNDLRPGPRVCDPRIRAFGRPWRVGEGHVGLAIEENALLVSGDLRQTAAWSPKAKPSDAKNYVSAVSVPLYFSGDLDAPDGVFIVTSSRLDHFRDLDADEVLTAEILGRMISSVGGPK